MTRLKDAGTLLALFLGSAMISASAYAENPPTNSAQSVATSAGQAVDSSLNKVGDFMDDSTITARVKAALIDDKNIRSSDISVKTENKVVTLSGSVDSAEQKDLAVNAAKTVKGVTTVNDQLNVVAEKSASLEGYAGDTAITSQVKAKLLADDIVPSRKVTVETRDGTVHLSGTVDSRQQADRAADIAKAVSGVKNVENNLSVK
ncbi:molecular chaperone OsmY [Raoultella ornithinolytica]|jgi:hyperosmotically inducible protein|uniref:molecular chaperone OsmY n=1 Tax=Raoultella ornithinolytica TaxID=54291 RepID=UPI000CA08D68|nr:molecular chaperone OsmY [Raoultella ornithinolytica]KAB8146942.1 molecular chaperone OsmY [Raoultella ornithinolytica]MBK2609430.1 molecular chaperone OsmY [Raoultella ornithinolytica]MDU0922676.1 molecular chaperone OsmY [Raoultella ornithinolytica]MDV1099701.1 molecular chaperone OsmY [Raoultella ornithinolytica]QLJ43628.1 molecular chaperone OsmY [Raoultella ornithinolytica]